jgi:hypothetical protein
MPFDERHHDFKRRSSSAWATEALASARIVGAAQPAHLALKLLDPLRFGCRWPLAHAAITLAPAYPASRRLGRTADLACHGFNRRPLRRLLIRGVEDHAHCTLDNLRGELR